MKQIYEPCKSCNGTGNVPVSFNVPQLPYTAQFYNNNIVETCKVCNGSGLGKMTGIIKEVEG
jgi:DnaJ-class molecular chaperone